jgi:hypothetical protein
MPFFRVWPPFRITAVVREKLLAVSPAAIGRALKADRKKLLVRGIRGTKPGKLLKKHIPVRTHYPWNERTPGFFEIDTIHRCGTRDAGEFCLTLDATDVASGGGKSARVVKPGRACAALLLRGKPRSMFRAQVRGRGQVRTGGKTWPGLRRAAFAGKTALNVSRASAGAAASPHGW